MMCKHAYFGTSALSGKFTPLLRASFRRQLCCATSKDSRPSCVARLTVDENPSRINTANFPNSTLGLYDPGASSGSPFALIRDPRGFLVAASEAEPPTESLSLSVRPLDTEAKQMGWVLAGCGAFAICGAVFDWEWFMHHRKAQFFVRLFGRTGARIFYGTLGVALVIVGVLMAMGSLQQSR